ncbi:O-antigen ligase family protein [Candidatus Microgenomates bacterium]|nr:O-antigen ligase family protein [Candidatus Microgenomates bacterium]
MEKAIKFLFILLLAVFPLGQLGRVELGGGINILFNDLIVFAVVMAWVASKIWRKNFPKTQLTKPIVIFTAAAVFSLILQIGKIPPPSIFASSLYLVRWIFYAGLYFVASDFDKSFRNKISYGFVAVGFVTILLGFVQYFLYSNLRNLYYAGWDEHLYRLFSSFLDPNFAGGIFVLVFILALSLFYQGVLSNTPPRWKRSYTSVILVMIAVVSFIALLLTYSRGSFLAFISGTLVFLLLTGRKKIIVFFLAVFIGGIILLPKSLAGEGVKLLRTASIEERLKSMEHAVAIFKDSPVFGVGFNTYRYAQKDYGFLPEDNWQVVHSGAGTDNSFLFVLATTGVVGFAAYLYFWVRVLREVRGSPMMVASIVGIFVHSFFVNSLFYPQILEWLWILLAISTVRRLS